jgi:Helicase
MRERVLEAQILSGDHAGEIALLPRISLLPASSDSLTVRFRRRQFPVRLAFALTINKAQGQSVKHVGLDLSNPVFSHGQLYVGLSRVTARQNLRLLLPPDAPFFSTPNVVYNEVILQ